MKSWSKNICDDLSHQELYIDGIVMSLNTFLSEIQKINEENINKILSVMYIGK